MSETREVLDAMEALRKRGEAFALATIVAVTGSTYRRPGARLVVAANGEMAGNVSAGCLEGEVATVAREVLEGGGPRIVAFDLTADDDDVWGWGLGCNGAYEILVEPGDPALEVAAAMRTAIEAERPLAVVTALASAGDVAMGARMLVHPGGEREGSLGEAAADEVAAGEALAALDDRASRTPTLSIGGETLRVFVEVLEPPLRLLVCGAGHDAVPLVRSAASLGWRVEVADDRPAFLTPDRFPEATGFVQVEDPARVADAAGVDDRTHVVVMTHNYVRDRDYLRALLATEVPYIGMMGPRGRLQRLLDDLDAGPEDRIHGPAGLDLGAEGPEEIAAAIVAEILAVRRGRDAGFLKDRTRPIHG